MITLATGKECMHNDDEYDQENELNDWFHGDRFSRQE
jgi:hypothetical protein